MAHKPFTLYKRPTTKPNKYVYYVQFRDSDTDKSYGNNKRLAIC